MRKLLTHLRLRPSLPDLLFAAIIAWLFVAGDGWSVLLADGDTGWHIRNGQSILSCRCIPHTDPFAFGTGGRPWYAWEWLADVIFAMLFAVAGLKGVVLFTGLIIALTFSLLFRQLLRLGADVFVAMSVVLLAVGASSIHFLARPHVFTLLFVVLSGWLLERDGRSSTRWIWTLPPLTVFWVNLHGGFLALFPSLAIGLAEMIWKNPRREVFRSVALRRRMLLAALCGAATLINPYGWNLHRHALDYLRSDWIRSVVDEFQSPRFRSDGMLHFEILLFLGIATAVLGLRKGHLANSGVIFFWAHQALGSVRHVPIYAILAAPAIAGELSRWWSEWPGAKSRNSFFGGLREISLDWRQYAAGTSAVFLTICFVLIAWSGAGRYPNDFPANKFPVDAVNQNLAGLSGSNTHPTRVFSSDQWGDYLIYRLYPSAAVYVDGRSDFFATWRGKDYVRLMQGEPGSAELLSSAGVTHVLLPANWPLNEQLRASGGWTKSYSDATSVLWQRVAQSKARRDCSATRDPLAGPRA